MKTFIAAALTISFFISLGGVRAVAADDDSPVRRIPLEVGTAAPDFTLPSATGEKIQLSSFRGKDVVVLYFYPKDFTPGCTKEAEDFRDDYEHFKKAGAVVLGVSVDDQSSHKQFASKMNLNFPILSDEGGAVSRSYGVMGWIMDKRVTYVIGRDGKIKFVDAEVDSHLPEQTKSLLKVVQQYSGPNKMKSKSKGKHLTH